MWDKNKANEYVVYDRKKARYFSATYHPADGYSYPIYSHFDGQRHKFVYSFRSLRASSTDYELRLMAPLVMEEGG